MKKLVLVFALLFSIIGFSQEKVVVPKTFEDIEQVMLPYVKDMLDGAKQGVDFVIQETPLVIQQYIYYEASKEILIILLGLGFLTFINRYITRQVLVKSVDIPTTSKHFITFISKGNNYWLKIDTGYGNTTWEQLVYYILKYIFVIVGSIIIITNIVDTIKVVFFPKLFLVENFIHLIT